MKQCPDCNYPLIRDPRTVDEYMTCYCGYRDRYATYNDKFSDSDDPSENEAGSPV